MFAAFDSCLHASVGLWGVTAFVDESVYTQIQCELKIMSCRDHCSRYISLIIPLAINSD